MPIDIPQKKYRRYYTPYEVATHNCMEDCWVSFLGGVYDLTPLIKVRVRLTLLSNCCRATVACAFTSLRACLFTYLRLLPALSAVSVHAPCLL